MQGEHYPCKPDIFSATYENASELRARDLKLAELARALPHKQGCPAELCAKCCSHIDGHEFSDFDHEFESMPCTCAPGDLLAMLGETKCG